MNRLAWPWWRLVLLCLSALGLALSAYLSWHHLTGGSVIGCGGGSGCDQVLTSRWSAIRGVLPVSGLAAGAYMAMLLACFFIGPATEKAERRLAWGALLVLAGAAAGSAVWFTIVQRWFIGAFCPYCMATHITGLVVAGLVIWRAPLQVDSAVADAAPTNPAMAPDAAPATAAMATVAPHAATGGEGTLGARGRVIGTRTALGLALMGLVLAGALPAFQIGYAPPAVYRAGEAQSSVPALDPHAVPLVGSPDAPYVVNLFFDYQCPHCQKVHDMLGETIRQYDGNLAFVLSPAPLNSQCNPYVSPEVEQFKDSCELARISLAVWVAKRDAFGDFDRWLFSPQPGQLWRPRTLEAAKAKAVELVGQAKFDAALGDPWIDTYMQTSMRMYGDTIVSGNAVPKLVFGARWVIAEPEDADGLVAILQRVLGVPKP